MRILHTMLRVTNLEKSLDFYTRILGMQLLRQKDYPEGRLVRLCVTHGTPTRPASSTIKQTK